MSGEEQSEYFCIVPDPLGKEQGLCKEIEACVACKNTISVKNDITLFKVNRFHTLESHCSSL